MSDLVLRLALQDAEGDRLEIGNCESTRISVSASQNPRILGKNERKKSAVTESSLTGHEGLLEGAWLEATRREGVLGGLGGEVGGAALRGGEGLRGERQHQGRAGLRAADAGARGHDRPRGAAPAGRLASGSEGARRPRGGGAQERHLVRLGSVSASCGVLWLRRGVCSQIFTV